MNTCTRLLVTAVALFVLGMPQLFGQVASSTQSSQQSSQLSTTPLASQNLATLQAYRKEQWALSNQEQALVAGGATPEQLETWHQQNASLFALQQRRAESMATASAVQLRTANGQPNIPADASPALRAFLATQATLVNARTQFHNQLVQQAAASGQSLTFAQLAQIEHQENQLFQQQNSALINLKAQQARALANAAAPMMRAGSAQPRIPANATPQMAAFLTTRYQIMQGLIQTSNQQANAAPAAREAAMQNWYKQNAGRFAQLQQEARNLSEASSSTQN